MVPGCSSEQIRLAVLPQWSLSQASAGCPLQFCVQLVLGQVTGWSGWKRVWEDDRQAPGEYYMVSKGGAWVFPSQ